MYFKQYNRPFWSGGPCATFCATFPIWSPTLVRVDRFAKPERSTLTS